MYVSTYTYGIRLYYTFPFKITEIILYTEFGIVIENQKKKTNFKYKFVKMIRGLRLRPFLMALTDLDLKPGIVYYFFTLSRDLTNSFW